MTTDPRKDLMCSAREDKMLLLLSGELPVHDREELESHISVCPVCSASLKELSRINDGLLGIVREARQLPPDTRERLEQRFLATLEAGKLGPATRNRHKETLPTSCPATVTPGSGGGIRHRFPVPLFYAAAAAALVSLTIVAVWVLSSHSPRILDVAVLAPEPTRGPTREAEISFQIKLSKESYVYLLYIDDTPKIGFVFPRLDRSEGAEPKPDYLGFDSALPLQGSVRIPKEGWLSTDKAPADERYIVIASSRPLAQGDLTGLLGKLESQVGEAQRSGHTLGKIAADLEESLRRYEYFEVVPATRTEPN